MLSRSFSRISPSRFLPNNFFWFVLTDSDQSVYQMAMYLLLTGTEEGGVFGIGSIPVAILPSCQYVKILYHNCIDIVTVG